MTDFRLELAAAKIDEVDGRGRKVVLHSLRHRNIKSIAETHADEALLPMGAAMSELPPIR